MQKRIDSSGRSGCAHVVWIVVIALLAGCETTTQFSAPGVDIVARSGDFLLVDTPADTSYSTLTQQLGLSDANTLESLNGEELTAQRHERFRQLGKFTDGALSA